MFKNEKPEFTFNSIEKFQHFMKVFESF